MGDLVLIKHVNRGPNAVLPMQFNSPFMKNNGTQR